MTSLDTLLTCDGTFGCDCPEQRKKLKKSKRRKNDISHGTRSGYQRHLREKTPACAPCTKANRDFINEYRKGRVHGAA